MEHFSVIVWMLLNVLSICWMASLIVLKLSEAKLNNAKSSKINKSLASLPPHEQRHSTDWGGALDRWAPVVGVLVALSSLLMLFSLEFRVESAQPLTARDASKIAQASVMFLFGIVIARRW